MAVIIIIIRLSELREEEEDAPQGRRRRTPRKKKTHPKEEEDAPQGRRRRTPRKKKTHPKEEEDAPQGRSVTRKMRTTTTAQSILKVERSCSTVPRRPLRDVWLPVMLTRVRHSSRKSSATHFYRCVQYFRVSRQWYGCQLLGFLTCAQMLTAISDVDCTDTVRESAVQVEENLLAAPGTRTPFSIASDISVGHCTN